MTAPLFRALLLALLAGLSAQSFAVIETYEFDNELQRTRYQAFVDEMRCPKCQNQNLSGSNSAIAEDLRRQLHRMIMDGKSDIEITQYMVQRYGDFVLYRPQFTLRTAALWLLPLGLLLLGLIIWWRLSASRREVAADQELSDEERRRLRQLLDEVERD